ncbi:YdaU family protein [Salmonella enterica]
MAALPYMQLYIADYLADTMHLSTEEHGAYLLLMFNYWQTGRAIPKNRLAKIARVSSERWGAVEESLREFFTDNGTEWVHKRIEDDLALVRETLAKRSAAGKASVQSRRSRKKTQSVSESNTCSTGVGSVFEHDVNKQATNKDTDPDKDTDLKDQPPKPPCEGDVVDGEKNVKKNRAEKFNPLNVELPGWLPAPLWAEWVEFRRALGKPVKTPQGATGLIRKLDEYRRQGFSPGVVISHSIANEYRGLFAPDSGTGIPPGGNRGRDSPTRIQDISPPDNTIPPGFKG